MTDVAPKTSADGLQMHALGTRDCTGARTYSLGRRGPQARGALAATLGLLGVVASSQTAHAHHTPGHGASEGVRTINSIGGTGGKALTRLLFLNETFYTGQGLNPGINESLSVYAEYAPVAAFSFGVQLPFTVAAFADNDFRPQAGLGDTRVTFRVTPHASKLIHRVFTTGVNLSLPTRTVRYTVDPGRVLQVSPYALFTRTYDLLYWQVIGIAVIDHRPAGVALDLSAGGQIGSKLAKGKMTLGLGTILDVRLANWHAQPGGGYEFSTATRPGEGLVKSSDERKIGATRAVGMLAMSIQTGKRSMITATLQAPLSELQDFSVGGSIGFQMVFDGSRRRRRKQKKHGHTHSPGGTHSPEGHTHGPGDTGGHTQGSDGHGSGGHTHGSDGHTHGSDGHGSGGDL